MPWPGWLNSSAPALAVRLLPRWLLNSLAKPRTIEHGQQNTKRDTSGMNGNTHHVAASIAGSLSWQIHAAFHGLRPSSFFMQVNFRAKFVKVIFESGYEPFAAMSKCAPVHPQVAPQHSCPLSHCTAIAALGFLQASVSMARI